MDNVTVQGVAMSVEAAGNVEMAGVDVAADVARVRAGLSAEDLLSECLDGVETEDRQTEREALEQGWRDYVEAVTTAADRAEDTCYCHGCGATIVRAESAHHDGEWYCDGCESAPAEE